MNRLPVTIRFSLDEQRDLDTLAAFLGINDQNKDRARQQALKVCFYQMVQSAKEVQKKLKEKENDAKQNATDSDDSAAAQPGDSVGPSDAAAGG